MDSISLPPISVPLLFLALSPAYTRHAPEWLFSRRIWPQAKYIVGLMIAIPRLQRLHLSERTPRSQCQKKFALFRLIGIAGDMTDAAAHGNDKG